MSKKIILFGGPHTGKTTLMNGLRQELAPSTHFVPEPAELIIAQELEREKQEPGYTGIYPTTRYPEFVHLVMAKSVELEAQIPPESDKALLDRSLIDNIAYARLNNHEHLIPSIERMVTEAGYTAALLCNFVGTYAQTAVRAESEEQAHFIHDNLVEAYEASGVKIIEIPALDVASRLAMATSVIEAL